MATKVHKITLMIVDHDGLGAEEIEEVLESQKYPNWCIAPQVIETMTTEVDWSDEHPLNNPGWEDVCEQLFKE